MKILVKSVIVLSLSACALSVSAQQQQKPFTQQPEQQLAANYDLNKPKLFKDLPDRINLRMNDFDHLFTYEVGKNVSLPLAPNFVFQGVVISTAEDVAANVKSIVVKSLERGGATFALSRIINENNTITYRGRIMSFKHGDAYDVVSENGAYFLIKKGLYDLYDE